MDKLRDISAIGAKIRSIRKAQGISQETLAGLAGTGQRYISEIERGKETARIREMLKVLDALGAGLYIADQKEAVEWNRLTSTSMIAKSVAWTMTMVRCPDNADAL